MFCGSVDLESTGRCSYDGPHLQGLHQQHAEIFQDSHDAMRSLTWHKDQKSVCALVLAIVKLQNLRARHVIHKHNVKYINEARPQTA